MRARHIDEDYNEYYNVLSLHQSKLEKHAPHGKPTELQMVETY